MSRWVFWTETLYSGVPSTDDETIYFGGYSGRGVYEQNYLAETDSGSDIDAILTTGSVAPAGGGDDYRIERLDAQFGATSHWNGVYGDANIEFVRDYDATKDFDKTVTPSDTARYFRLGGFGNARWSDGQIIVTSVDGEPFTLIRMELRYSLAKRHRGVEPSDV